MVGVLKARVVPRKVLYRAFPGPWVQDIKTLAPVQKLARGLQISYVDHLVTHPYANLGVPKTNVRPIATP